MAGALEFERALKVQPRPANNLDAISTDRALHTATAGAELLCAKRVLAQPPRPIGSQCAMYRTGCRILIDSDRREKHSAHVVHITLAGSGNNRSVPGIQFGKSGNIR